MAPTILVVGGGFAGRAAVRYLLDKVDKADQAHIVLVDDKPFFEFTPSTLRCIVHPGHIRRITFSQHSDPAFTFVLGRVTGMNEREATLSRRDDEHGTVFAVPYDYCVWATGVSYVPPIRSPHWRHNPTISRRRVEFKFFRQRVLAASEVLIIGAGPIGVELAAELICLIRTKSTARITLASSPRGVLHRFPQRAGDYAKTWLERRGVHVVMARLKPGLRLPGGRLQYQDNSDPPVVVTPDVAFDCTGAKDNGATAALVDGGLCDASLVQRDGSLMVLATLQLADSPHIFIAGDASRVPGELDLGGLACEKTAYAAEESGKLAARNVTMLMRSENLIRGQPRRLFRYPRDAFPQGKFPRLVVVSLYKYHGILCVGPVVIPGVLPCVFKFAIEVFGVSAAKSNNIAALLFRILEKMAYFVANVFALISKCFARRRTAA